MKKEVKEYLESNYLFVTQVYQTNFDNISYDKDYLEKKADGKSPVYQSFVIVDKYDLEALKTSNDIYYNESGFNTINELEEYIIEEKI